MGGLQETRLELEDLAERAGYNESFVPLRQHFFTLPTFPECFPTSFDQEHFAAFGYANDGENKTRPSRRRWREHKKKFNLLEDTPRTMWNEQYADLFTKLKRSGGRTHFVDCWRLRETDELHLLQGTFEDRYEVSKLTMSYEGEPAIPLMYEGDLGYVLQLTSLRAHTPPDSILRGMWYDIPGLTITVGSLSLALADQPIIGLGVYSLYSYLHYTTSGNGVFARRNATFDAGAIRQLRTEATLLEQPASFIPAPALGKNSYD
jgi:hypothetical protein